MTLIKMKNIFSSLSEAVPDPDVGISLAHLVGDELFSLYVTQIPAHSHLTAHFHKKGDEIYQVIEGAGMIWLEDVLKSRSDTHKTKYEVKTGDTFIVPALTAHQLVNPGPGKLIMLFGCPQSHIKSDRILIDNLKPEIEGE